MNRGPVFQTGPTAADSSFSKPMPCAVKLCSSLCRRGSIFAIPIGFYPKRIDKRARLAYNNSPKARQASYFWIEKGKHEQRRKKRISLAVWLALILLTLAGCLTDSAGQSESIQELMRDAVLHDGNQIDLFGLRVNPGLISAFTVTALLS